jgi:hypothetical protein
MIIVNRGIRLRPHFPWEIARIAESHAEAKESPLTCVESSAGDLSNLGLLSASAKHFLALVS